MTFRGVEFDKTFVSFHVQIIDLLVTIYWIQQYKQVNYVCTSQGETPADFECRIHHIILRN